MSSDQAMSLPLYLSIPVDCNYLPDRKSRSLFVDPEARMDVSLYSRLIDKGFRRSGRLVYQPHCENCQQCLPVRVPVERFHWSRRFRRILKHNRDLRLVPCKPGFVESHYALYQRYTKSRHAGGSMTDSTPGEYMDFLTADWCDTQFLEVHRGDHLMAVAATDRVDDGLSAVYTFFDPDEARRSLGTYTILAQIRLCQQLGLPYLYLGFWIRDCNKMRYKADFRPVQILSSGQWLEFGASEPIDVVELRSEQTP